MPHVHSPASRAKRLARAVARGYLAPLHAAGSCSTRRQTSAWVEVPRTIAMRVKNVAKSMSIHREHCELLGESVHTPSIAAARVKPFIGAQQYNEARRCHRIAGIAKHSWCDLGDERRKQSWADLVDEAGFDSAASTAVPSEGIELDPVFVNDPWRHACNSGLLCSFSSDAAFPAPASLPSVGIDDCLPVPRVTATPYNTSPSRALDAAVQVSFFPQAILSLQKSVDDSNALVKQLEARTDLLSSNCKEQHALICSLSGHILCLRQEQRSPEVHTACSPVSDSPVRNSDTALRDLDGWKDSCLKDVNALVLEHLNQAKSDAHLLLSESLERACEQTMMLARTVADESSGVLETAMGKLSGLFNDKIASVVKRVAKLESKLVQPRVADCPDVCNSDTLPPSAASLRGSVDGMTKDVETGDLCRARADDMIDDSGMNDPSPSGDEVKPLVPCAEPVPGVPTLENSSLAFVAEMEPPVYVGQFVTLGGLKASHLNGRSGQVACYIESTGRFGVRLHKDKENKAFLPQNLWRYKRNGELCKVCGVSINLNAFPPCDCSNSTAPCGVLAPLASASSSTESNEDELFGAKESDEDELFGAPLSALASV